VKAKIHPRYRTCTVHCACGNTFTTRSTLEKINVDICSNCHPFFTGKQKFVDTAGRVERFSKKFGGSYSFQKTATPPAAAVTSSPPSRSLNRLDRARPRSPRQTFGRARRF
jgi:large subunit ribosomal protein L31